MTTHCNGSASTRLVGNLALSQTACGCADPADTLASDSQGRLAVSTQGASIAKSSTTHSVNVDAELTAKKFAQGEIQAQEADASQPPESLPTGSIAASAAPFMK